MNTSIGILLRGAIWTIGAFGTGQIIRLATNIVLTHILAPKLFGLMTIVLTLRIGIELISDLGIGQNIIHNKNAFLPDFYNTAWSLQLIRSIILWLVFLVAAIPVSKFYDSAILTLVMPTAGVGIIIGGFTSVSPSILQKRMQFGKLNSFQLTIAAVSSALTVLFAYLSPTIWALVFGGLASAAGYAIGSYFLLPEIKQKFYISKQFVWEIINFGKWIFLSSIVYFSATNFDRLYFAKVVPLELLGIYGIARSISELLSGLTANLGNHVIFPFLASHSDTPRARLHEQLASSRAKFLLLVAVGCSLLVATADFAVKILYDARYHAATWMLPIMVVGSWFSIVANINESSLLGLGKPSYSAITNSLKFALLLFALPLTLKFYGLVGGIIAITLIELSRYIPIYVGQRRERFSFGRQDLAITLVMILMIGVFEWLRWSFGLGTSFDSLPIQGWTGRGG